MVWDDNVAEFGLIDRELCESSKKLCYRKSYFDGSNAYTLMHREDFPTIVIGKRMIVTKDKLLQWMEQQASA